MKKFFSNLLNSENSTSSRRFVALVALFLLVVLVVAHLFGVEVSNEVLWTVSGLVTVALGLARLK